MKSRVRAVMKTARDIVDGDLSSQSPTILVAEDDALVRRVVADYLRDCGFPVIEAGTADEAIRLLETSERVDIVFSDVQMPGSLDGFALAQWVRREQPDMKVILTSGAPQTVGVAGELCDAGPLMRKPYKLGELAHRIRKLVAAPLRQAAGAGADISPCHTGGTMRRC
jgi:CheY-like chemotaxis protein